VTRTRFAVDSKAIAYFMYLLDDTVIIKLEYCWIYEIQKKLPMIWLISFILFSFFNFIFDSKNLQQP